MITIDTRVYQKGTGLKPPRPPFCPNPVCPHHSFSPQGRWYAPRGSRINNRHGRVWLYLCGTCERSFSSSSFLVSYYEKVSLSYDKIIFYARKGISLSEWADLMKTSPGALKLRLCKIGSLLINRLSDLCRPAAEELLAVVHGMAQRGEKGYQVLRELILLAIAKLKILEGRVNKVSKKRPFLSYLLDRRKNLFLSLRLLCCSWRYIINSSIFYHTKYQWE